MGDRYEIDVTPQMIEAAARILRPQGEQLLPSEEQRLSALYRAMWSASPQRFPATEEGMRKAEEILWGWDYEAGSLRGYRQAAAAVYLALTGAAVPPELVESKPIALSGRPNTTHA